MNFLPFAAGGVNPPRPCPSARRIPARRSCFLIWIAAALLAAGTAGVARAQAPAADRAATGGGNRIQGEIESPVAPDELMQQETIGGLTPMERRKLWEHVNAARQRSMVSDVQRLLELTGELRTALGDTRHVPSAGELRKVKEIQKLARQVEESMKEGPMPE
jgi:hypothetical protein